MADNNLTAAKQRQFVAQNMRHLSRGEALQVARLVQVRDVNVGEDCEPGEAPTPPALVLAGADAPLAVNLDALEPEMLRQVFNIVHACRQRLNQPAKS